MRSVLGTFGPEGPKNPGMRSKRVHFPTPAGVGAKKGTFEPQKGSKNEGYTRAKITDFWSPTFISIFEGPVLVEVQRDTTNKFYSSLHVYTCI